MKYGLSERSFELMQDAFRFFDEIESVIIFGSRAMGNYKKGSDVDIAIKGKKVNHDVIATLHTRLNEELPLPYFFDVIGYDLVESVELKKHVDEHGKVLYQK